MKPSGKPAPHTQKHTALHTALLATNTVYHLPHLLGVLSSHHGSHFYLELRLTPAHSPPAPPSSSFPHFWSSLFSFWVSFMPLGKNPAQALLQSSESQHPQLRIPPVKVSRVASSSFNKRETPVSPPYTECLLPAGMRQTQRPDFTRQSPAANSEL